MDINNLANMKLSDFENIGQVKYNEGFKTALTIVIRLLSSRLCEDFNADGECEHELCKQNNEMVEGLESAIRNVG
jgi:hypothetical protein